MPASEGRNEPPLASETGNGILAGEGATDTLTGGLGADKFNGGSGTANL